MSESRDAVLKARYFHEGETTWEEVCARVAKYWSSSTEHERAIFEMMISGRALPNTPAIANAGREVASGSACYVLPINDSLVDGDSSIMQTLKDAAAVHKTGGGTGFDFSRIRPKGSLVRSTGRGAPGPVSVLKMYSAAIASVTQAGMRNGANMGILRVDHPDILDFVKCKATEGDIHNFNISVALTDDFMYKVVQGKLDHHEQFIWDSIVEGAWLNGEPGVFFVDTTNRKSFHPELMEATNPCGEVPLRPYEACVLGSINLAQHMGISGRLRGVMDTARTLVELLDNVIEFQDYPLPEIKREQQRYRKIGVGVMGYADALVMNGVKYGSPEAVRFMEKWMKEVNQSAYRASTELASTRGTYYGYQKGMPKRRNLNCLVQAPTGSISRLAECSFGIEPHFDVDSEGNFQSFIVGGQFTDHNKYFDDPAFTPASDVTFAGHIDTMAACQKWVDQAVSKTINCPYETTLEEVSNAYIQAWKRGLKGMTLLREGSRNDTVISVAKEGDCNGVACAV